MLQILTRGKLNKRENVEELLSLYDSKKSIRSFYKLIRKMRYRILKERFFHIRHSHEIRYGLKTWESKIICRIPLKRDQSNVNILIYRADKET